MFSAVAISKKSTLSTTEGNGESDLWAAKGARGTGAAARWLLVAAVGSATLCVVNGKLLASESGNPAAPSFTCQQLDGIGKSPFNVASGDWNGDRQLDLAVSFAADGTVGILWNRGPRQYALQQALPVGDVPRGIHVGDINRDGFLDLTVANAMTDDVAVLLGDGAGHFKKAPAGILPGQRMVNGARSEASMAVK